MERLRWLLDTIETSDEEIDWVSEDEMLYEIYSSRYRVTTQEKFYTITSNPLAQELRILFPISHQDRSGIDFSGCGCLVSIMRWHSEMLSFHFRSVS
ncbi:hypothetical protein NPIL_2001 [Nephila pilipes]|uniref:Uncharacterized protein n=1 Tax=Nephila pilipes TaxID=299642 RepID=A0A8X6U149_NEPPI|nr:hypothetical protein NPIL_2001 [Nephila pilipes]